jgi:putative transcriptional regulator
MRTRIKVLRAERGITQAELAQRVGVARQTINSIEGAKFEPSLGLGMRIAKVLGATVEETFSAD